MIKNNSRLKSIISDQAKEQVIFLTWNTELANLRSAEWFWYSGNILISK